MAGGISSAHAQVVVRFANDIPAVNAPFYDVDGTTRLSGPTFRATLYARLIESPPDAWTRLNSGQPFRTGAFAGFWVGVDIPLPYPPGSTVIVQVRFWDSRDGTIATHEEAETLGASIGVSQQIAIQLLGPPTALVGLQSAGLVPTITLTRGVPGIVTASTGTVGGTQLSALCGIPVGANRWFRLTSVQTGEAIVATGGSDIDTVLAAYTGSIVNPAALLPITCNDDRTLNVTTSEVRFPVESNRLYLLCVAGKNGSGGTIRLNHTLATPLLISRSQNQHVELSWPADATNFVPESTINFSELTDWRMITNAPLTITNRRIIQLDCAAPQAAYRLRLNTP